MPKMHYLSYVRFPTEKAHGLQIAQNCEAFVEAGYDVDLWVSTRKLDADMRAIIDIHAHYGVDNTFKIKRIPSLDLYPLANKNLRLEYIAHWVHVVTYCVMMLLKIWSHPADIYYSRDRYIVLALSLIIPREKIVFEVHQFSPTSQGGFVQRTITKRINHIITITPKLKQDFIDQHHATSEQILVAHDGIRAKRFAEMLDRATAREMIHWDSSAFIVGYMGRLHTMGMDKGVGLVVKACATLDDVSLALVGGPDEMAQQYGQQWLDYGGNSRDFLNAGTVPPDDIPLYLAAFDVCVMPFPWTEHYAYYMSPLKLFEYMASGAVILATNLPSVVDVVTQGETAYLVEPDNTDAIRDAIITLKNDPELRQQLADNAREKVFASYTWSARAQHIKSHLERLV